MPHCSPKKQKEEKERNWGNYKRRLDPPPQGTCTGHSLGRIALGTWLVTMAPMVPIALPPTGDRLRALGSMLDPLL